MNPLWQQIITQQGLNSVVHTAAGQSLVAILDDLVIIEVSGSDAEKFLHSQFTNDVTALTEDAVQLQAYCNPKGRMFSCFQLFRTDTGFAMVVTSDVVNTITKRLSMFVMRSDVMINLRDDLLLIGLYQPQPSEFGQLELPTDANGLNRDKQSSVCYQIANTGCYHYIAERDSMLSLLSTEAAQQLTDQTAWHWQLIQHGQPQITAATSELLVPQMANLDLIEGVSFTKGCYPGQEIVARMHYLGKLKQRTVGLHCVDTIEAKPGDKIISADKPDQSLGIVLSTANNPEGGTDLLASIRQADLDTKQLHINDTNGPLVLLFDLLNALNNPK